MALKRAALPFLVVVAFLACYFSTSPDYIGDTTRWAADAVRHAQGVPAQFWEFGHLLWRPWAFLGYSLLSNWYAHMFGDTPAQAVVRFLVQTNFVCSVLTLLLLFLILRRVVNAWIAAAVGFAMNCSTAFLNYSHSGAPYIPALMFSMLALHLLIVAFEREAKGRLYACLGGVSFAVACGLWFPYAFSGLGMLAVLYFWPSASIPRGQLIWVFLGSLSASAFLLFLGGAAAQGIASVTELAQWIRESGNGWQQSRNLLRALTGVPRSMWDLGTDTIFLKRWLWSDPFNPASIHQMWAFRLGAKLALFYLGLSAAALALWNKRRWALHLLVAGGLPVFLFAVTLFEPSSTERFFPVFPFAFLAFAVALNGARDHFIPSACVALFLGSMIVVNLAGNWSSNANARLIRTHQRIEALNSGVQPGALVFVVTFYDDIYGLPALKPLDHTLAISRFRVIDTVAVAQQLTTKWRAAFAKQTLEQWDKNGEVWVSERHLAARPESEWRWVEGDDPRVHWPEVPALFTALEYDSKVLAGSDGFLRLARNQANRERLVRELGTTALGFLIGVPTLPAFFPLRPQLHAHPARSGQARAGYSSGRSLQVPGRSAIR